MLPHSSRVPCLILSLGICVESFMFSPLGLPVSSYLLKTCYLMDWLREMTSTKNAHVWWPGILSRVCFILASSVPRISSGAPWPGLKMRSIIPVRTRLNSVTETLCADSSTTTSVMTNIHISFLYRLNKCLFKLTCAWVYPVVQRLVSKDEHLSGSYLTVGLVFQFYKFWNVQPLGTVTTVSIKSPSNVTGHIKLLNLIKKRNGKRCGSVFRNTKWTYLSSK